MHKNFSGLVEEIIKLTENELNLSNKKHSTFHSKYEGLGILTKELWEHTEDIEMLNKYFKKIQLAIYSNEDNQHLRDLIIGAYNYAVMAASEMIQVAAMCKKLENLTSIDIKNIDKCEHPVRYKCNDTIYCPECGTLDCKI